MTKARTMATMLRSTMSVGRPWLGGGGCYSQQVGKDDAILERLGDPDQVQRVLVDADLLGEQRGVVGAEEAAAVWVHTDAEVADADLELRGADEVGNGRAHARVDLRRVVGRRVGLVVEADDEDAGDERGGGGAAGEEESWGETCMLAGFCEGGEPRCDVQSNIIAIAIRIIKTW